MLVTDDVLHYTDKDEIDVLDLGNDEVFAQFAQEKSIPDWIMETVQHAWRIVYQSGNRYRELPSKISYEAYEDMQSFIETLDDDRVVARLEKAIVGKGAFRRFKDTLRYDENVLQAWYVYQTQIETAWILGWLKSEGIEVVADGEAEDRA